MTRKFLSFFLLSLSLAFTQVPLSAASPTDWSGLDSREAPWVRNTSLPYEITEGLGGRHVALWASHGRFYDQDKGCWRWQRPALYTTCEDLFTQTIVVPFLIPMLENAGAVVFTPRERDWQRHEVIVDNDGTVCSVANAAKTSLYTESPRPWQPAPAKGFAFHPGPYHDGENPFEAGSARMISTTTRKSKQTTVSYQPQIPQTGRYAVYVSYQTLPESIDDAHYTVYHQGQSTTFQVNQRMGGATWVYLGTFFFDKGCSEDNRVVLSNLSSHEGMVTTDAVRFGGGMGNIERGGTVSGMPRCLEGARYWAQWAGMPYSIYSSKNGENDYGDDINARSLMLNELCGGSVYAPDSVGRKVPIELSLAVHSDAGYNKPYGFGVYGSLTICTTKRGDPTLASGRSREMSKELASELLDNLTSDLQFKYRTWVPREVRDKNYSGTRLPYVPSAILETLSHQSFSDMRRGLDPNFRFTLARSIYKTLARYICRKHNEPCVIAPLAPRHFRIEFMEGTRGEIRLSWKATPDPKEPSAKPTAYVLYIAEGDGDFDNGMLVEGNSILLRLRPGSLVHFRVAAVNKGGRSFPSQVLSACYQSEKAPTVMVVDGFHRLSGPALCEEGFDLDEDPGISYGLHPGILGHQQGFDLNRIGIEDSTGLGFTASDMEGRFVGGNEFCYVRTHATAIHHATEYNILSCSSEALEGVPLYKYHAVDLLLGLERSDGHSMAPYKSFTPIIRNAIAQYASQGGRLLVSGAYVGSDMQQDDEQRFCAQVLKSQFITQYREPGETVKGLGTSFDFYHQLCEEHYAATSCDVLMPAEQGAFPAMVYADGTSAAVAYRDEKYRSFCMGFPLECIKDPQKRASIIQGILNFLLK